MIFSLSEIFSLSKIPISIITAIRLLQRKVYISKKCCLLLLMIVICTVLHFVFFVLVYFLYFLYLCIFDDSQIEIAISGLHEEGNDLRRQHQMGDEIVSTPLSPPPRSNFLAQTCKKSGGEGMWRKTFYMLYISDYISSRRRLTGMDFCYRRH